MYEQEAATIKGFQVRLDALRDCLNIEGCKARIAQLEKELSAPDFWERPENAQKVMQQLKGLKDAVAEPEALEKELEDAQVLVKLAQDEQDGSMSRELAELADSLEKKLRQLEMTSLLADARDGKNAILNVHPGAGGTESCDWAGMLYRMIVRWCERRAYQVQLVDYQPGEEAGLKSATLTVEGPFAYGYLKSEAGVHRLVRISPFDANSRRHTSFAAIEVLPQIDEDIQVDVKEEEIKLEFFRASGPGGQKVNKTSSAVRLTHLPTGIVVACQVERSQHRNRAVALQLLKAQLYDREVKRQEAELAAHREGQMDVAWGSQIRSYVLQPYQLVKDHRTGVETGNVERVLDGDLEMFVEGYLKWDLERRRKN